MKKKNIRKYILEALAGLLVIGACLTIDYLCTEEALAATTEVGRITFQANDQIGSVTPSDLSFDKSLIKESDRSSVGGLQYENENGAFKIDITGLDAGTYIIQLSAFRVNSISATPSGETEKTFTISDDGGNKSVSQAASFGTVSLSFVDPDKNILVKAEPKETASTTIGHLADENAIKSELSNRVEHATLTYSNTGENTDTHTVDVNITGWTSYDGTSYDSGNLNPQTVKFKGSVTLPTSTPSITDKNHKLDTGPVVTVTVEAATTPITWSGITVTPTINVNGTRDTSGKTVSEYTYQVVDNNGTVLRGGITGASPLSGSATATGALADNYKIKLTGAKVDGTVYTPTGTIETTDYNPSSYVISGTLSPVINVTTKPSEYNKLKAAVVKNDDDDYIEISKIDTDLRDSILDYVYENNVNGLKSVIQDIMNSGSELSIKVVSKKLDSSDVDSDVKKDLKKEAQKPSGAGSADILNYYDITVYLTKDGRENSAWKVTNTGSDNKIKVTLKAKSSSSSSSGKRYYMALIYHSGDADNLTDYDTSNSITVKTHKFSTYAVSYYDSSSSSSSSASTPKSNSAIVPGDDGTGAGAGGTDKSKTPKTGDDFNPRIWIYLLIVCATVASAAWILLQDTREDNEKKQK